MKKILLAIVIGVSLFVTPVMASSETCALSDGTECDIWMFHSKEGHWRACVNHLDKKGNTTLVGEVEEHNFADGICTVCEAEESNGVGVYSYLFVFIVVFGISLLLPMRMKRNFKKNNFEEHPFGLDKFRKF